MITFKQKGQFSKITGWLERVRDVLKNGVLDKYGEIGVNALKSATPVDSGETAASWYYKIEHRSGSVVVGFYNSHFNQNVPIAVILQYGHGTGTGGYVEGIDYINPALRPVFESLASAAWEEVVKS